MKRSMSARWSGGHPVDEIAQLLLGDRAALGLQVHRVDGVEHPRTAARLGAGRDPRPETPWYFIPASRGSRSSTAREFMIPQAWSSAPGVAWVNPSAACSSGGRRPA
jgi:hypothetical protein